MYIGYFIIKHFIAYMSSLMFCGLVWVHTTDDYIDRAVPEQVVIPSVVHRLRYWLTFIQFTPAAVATDYAKSTLVDTSSNSQNINFD